MGRRAITAVYGDPVNGSDTSGRGFRDWVKDRVDDAKGAYNAAKDWVGRCGLETLVVVGGTAALVAALPATSVALAGIVTAGALSGVGALTIFTFTTGYIGVVRSLDTMKKDECF